MVLGTLPLQNNRPIAPTTSMIEHVEARTLSVEDNGQVSRVGDSNYRGFGQAGVARCLRQIAIGDEEDRVSIRRPANVLLEASLEEFTPAFSRSSSWLETFDLDLSP